jgi:Tfp pilus assembly protein PilX
MGAMKRLLADQRGMILVLSLLILALLMGAGAGAIISTQTDLKTSSNLKTASQAFYLAEAGIEWAKQEVKKSGANPPNPSGSTQSLSPGSFTVSFSDSTKESQVVGYVTATSTGTVGNSTATIIARVKKTYEITDGAISMRGADAGASFTGNAFVVDGKDYTTAGTLVSNAKQQYGISVPNSTLDSQVTSAVAAMQTDNIVGKGGTQPNIEQSDFMPSSEMTQLADDLCSQSNAITSNISGAKLDVPTNQVWGTALAPQLRCINGQTTGTYAATDKVEFAGNFTGAGILVVKNANVEIYGAWHWEGLIIVTGANVGFKVAGGGNKDIYGSIMINETTTDTPVEVDLAGAVNVRYSSAALQNALNLFSSSQNPLQGVYDSMPSSISTVYWRTASN